MVFLYLVSKGIKYNKAVMAMPDISWIEVEKMAAGKDLETKKRIYHSVRKR